MHKVHSEAFREAIISCLLNTLPKDYREEAKYCFYELEKKEEQTIFQVLPYLIGGLEYRFEDCYEIFNQALAILAIGISKRLQLLFPIELFNFAVFRKVLISCLLNTLPRDYREEAKYCFYELTKKEEQTIIQVLPYLIGGLEYRFEDCCEIFHQAVTIFGIGISKRLQLKSDDIKIILGS